MARPEYVKSLLGGVEPSLKAVLSSIIEYILGNLRTGPLSLTTRRAENFQWYYYEATTAAADVEFTVEHGLQRVPFTLIPHLNLQTPGAKLIRLTVTRAPDTRRIYLSSPDADAPCSFWLEA